ncbi:hypothetical protein PanWU01x14_372180 [Parasponia andersonii]|uniref:Uncharacterized protein n=1 Tax=Parasponia andersonii TaxID=3476 RepID=A0A2P5A3M4_PARAD|nr:hypothetical protein PanWU01x14_372180 [Parasponia andersonii]
MVKVKVSIGLSVVKKNRAIQKFHQHHVFMCYMHYDYHKGLDAVEAKFILCDPNDYGFRNSNGCRRRRL